MSSLRQAATGPRNLPGTPTLHPMDRPHDLGGYDGFGPVPVHLSQAANEHWKRLAYALGAITSRVAGVNPDALRHVMERLPAADYQRLNSAGRWLAVAERCAVEGGLVAPGEVADRARLRAAGLSRPDPDAYPEPGPSQFPSTSGPGHNKREPPPGAIPRFQPGDRVRTSAAAPSPPTSGHTRLPSYLRAKTGTVIAVNGYWVFPDTNAHTGDEAPTYVYAVQFDAADMWPGTAAAHTVSADLYEPYLQPAEEAAHA